ncbi:hypothetical protein [Marinobacter confluentis]|uniref:DUF4410 domain-containing protein n=1 Tax=Marinobacter confluentis TaxID=1697557 RepID=A0A4Z1C8M1_9GAMM|nr:hypothetical protein [Marinobacter confluentis]TGN39348.1 hypothetical protein E5Q11_11960 [Marinobacter confluentis]
MKNFAPLILMLALFSTGCASLNNQATEFRTPADISVRVSNGQFDAVELEASETLLWQKSELVGIISIIKTNTHFQTAIEEVKRGFKENIQSSEETRKLDLPEGVFGFSSSMGGFTTAFIASEDIDESWIKISVRDSFFDEVLSSISAD